MAEERWRISLLIRNWAKTVSPTDAHRPARHIGRVRGEAGRVDGHGRAEQDHDGDGQAGHTPRAEKRAGRVTSGSSMSAMPGLRGPPLSGDAGAEEHLGAEDGGGDHVLGPRALGDQRAQRGVDDELQGDRDHRPPADPRDRGGRPDGERGVHERARTRDPRLHVEQARAIELGRAEPCAAGGHQRGHRRAGRPVEAPWTYDQRTMDARIMGILNVTPDSFSDGGEWFDVRSRRRARAHADRRGRRHPRHRRRVDPSAAPSRWRSTRSCAASSPSSGRCAEPTCRSASTRRS